MDSTKDEAIKQHWEALYREARARSETLWGQARMRNLEARVTPLGHANRIIAKLDALPKLRCL